MKKILFLLTFIVLLLNNCYAISIDELVDSYDFSYQDASIQIENKTYNLSGDLLNIKVDFKILNSLYDIYYKIKANSTTYLQNSTKKTLNDNMPLDIIINLSKLPKNNYTFSLFIENENITYYKNYSFFQFEFLNSEENYSYEGLKYEKYVNIENLITNQTLQKPFLADIKITSFNYNKDNNSIQFNIENIGKKDIGLFYYGVYDENFSQIKINMVDVLKINSSIMQTIYLNNSYNELVIVVDLYDFYEEEDEMNNIYFWPEDKKNKKKTQNSKSIFISSGSGGGGNSHLVYEDTTFNEKNTVISQNLSENKKEEVTNNNFTKKSLRNSSIITEKEKAFLKLKKEKRTNDNLENMSNTDLNSEQISDLKTILSTIGIGSFIAVFLFLIGS